MLKNVLILYQLILDESTCSLDPESEEKMYKFIIKYCDTFISIGNLIELLSIFLFLILMKLLFLLLGHKDSLKLFHNLQLDIKPNGKYSIVSI